MYAYAKNITSQVQRIYPVNTEFYGDKIIVFDCFAKNEILQLEFIRLTI